jgi:hypothetical protein
MKPVSSSLLLLFSISFLMLSSCKKSNDSTADDSGPKLIFKYKFDSSQIRLDNLGQPSSLPAGHSAQSPVFNGMSSHYVELAPSAFTALGAGQVLYKSSETTAGGSNAIEFEKETVAKDGEVFLSVPLKNIKPGSYEYLRVSLAYQNYDIKVRYNGLDFTGTLASFIGFNTFIKSFKPKTVNINVNANKLQGYWAFEAYNQTVDGQAPAGATTVPNPIFASSPIPQGSCVVTGPFAGAPLQITGQEKNDVVVIVSLSINKSFEWTDQNADGLYEPAAGDTVTDMGIRGLIPIIQ